MALLSPTPDRSQLKRQAFSSPTRIGLTTSDLTPADSGYGSTFVSPDRCNPESPQRDVSDQNLSLLELLDGTRSSNISPSSDDTDVETARVKEALPRRLRSASATLPRYIPSSRLTLPAHFFSESNIKTSERLSATPLRRPKSGSLRVPDRFVPLRDTTTPVSDVFRITKGISQLSTSEKLVRNHSAASDAFVYQRRLVSPMASDYRLISRSDTRAVRSRGKL